MLFWIRFPEIDRPFRTRTSCFVSGKNFKDAVEKATLLGINTGGDPSGLRFDFAKVERKWRNKILSNEDVKEFLSGNKRGVGPPAEWHYMPKGDV